MVAVDDAVGDAEAHHKSTGGGLFAVKHAGVFDADVHVVSSDVVPVTGRGGEGREGEGLVLWLCVHGRG